MIIPRITKPYEPGLPALGDDLENYLQIVFTMDQVNYILRVHLITLYMYMVKQKV